MIAPHIPQNGLLAALPAADWNSMRASFSEIELRLGDVLLEPDVPTDHLYFPTRGFISTVSIMENGTSVEMATVGAEGMISFGAILGSRSPLSKQVVQVAGRAMLINHNDFTRWREAIPGLPENPA